MADTEVPQVDEDYIFISALNQYSYCPLRCYWMFVEHEYADNEHTIEGSLGHCAYGGADVAWRVVSTP